MKKYPPSQEEVLDAFVKSLNHGGASYEVVERPDQAERQRPEIDYVLREASSGREIAIEVTSIWRSSSAGKEDNFWEHWTAEIGTLMRGRVPGKYRMYTPLRVPGMKADAFATEATAVVLKRCAELAALRQQGKGLNLQILGADVFLSQGSTEGSEVSFARRLGETDLGEFPQRAREAVASRATKLKHHKTLGRETWLVVYNTFWTANGYSRRPV